MYRKDTLIIMTGGTIDAEAYPDPKNPPKNATMLKESRIPETLKGMGVDDRCDFLSWKAKDSKHFTDEDMRDLAKIIRTSSAKNIIITHGTDAMPDNARRIEALLRQQDTDLRKDLRNAAYGREDDASRFVRGEKAVGGKRIIFTGAMMPLANGKASDAYQNLDYILHYMDSWKPGVRAVMHGMSFKPKSLYKDFKTYEFHGQVIADAQSYADMVRLQQQYAGSQSLPGMGV